MENRLDEAASPYLQQHADNPVAWQPWDDDALALARERDVPIFLSIGYAACHWCHVMEDESFHDEEIASILNNHFVPIKVDREERPDIDSVYMRVCQLVRGGGGWPLSVWLTPDQRPFHIGTYFPPEAKHGRPGFLEVLESITETWRDTDARNELEDRADTWTAALEGEFDPRRTEPMTPALTEDDPVIPPAESATVEVFEAAATDAVRTADNSHGGWGSSQKFPQPSRIHLTLWAEQRLEEPDYGKVARDALDAMASGGLYDHVGGGFHRYCVDPDWTVPHFEKMLYDNATIPRAFLAGYQATGRERYAEVAAETFAFLERELTHPDGGLFATLDAESESPKTGTREEGAFYVWTPDQIDESVEDTLDAELFRDRFGIDEGGNFEHGTTVLTESRGIEELATAYDLSASEVVTRIERAREQVFAAREDRPRPPRDEKVLAGWNGLAIQALAEGGIVLDDTFTEQARAALSFCRERLWDSDAERLHRRYYGGRVGIPGYLDDYAFLGNGALTLYEATGDIDHLVFARDLARCIHERFWDGDSETLYFTPKDAPSLIARPNELTDASTPASTGAAVQFLERIRHFTPVDDFDESVEGTLRTHRSTIESNPLSHTSLVLAMQLRAEGPLELTFVAEERPAAWRQRLSETYLPTRLISQRPPTDAAVAPSLDALGIDEPPPIWAGRTAVDNKPTVYACRNATCSPPVHDLDRALEWASAKQNITD